MCNKEWSIKFDTTKFNEFLFATGDAQKWLISDKAETTGTWYANNLRLIKKSSTNPNTYRARWYRRSGNKEDPWISLTDHGPAISQGNILYGEQHYGGNHARKILPIHKGANVYIRWKGTRKIIHMF